MSSDFTDNAVEQEPYWISPCQGAKSPTGDKDDKDSLHSVDEEIIDSVITVAKIALHHTESFREDYVLTTFKVKLWDHHSTWKYNKYPWLWKDMIIAKELGEDAKEKDLENLNLGEESAKIYGFLQRLAVGMEQIKYDHVIQKLQYTDEFVKIEIHIREVLCELGDIVPQSKCCENPNRQIMDVTFRKIDNLTHQHLRDWFIFRDYMNLLEYLIQFLEFFKSKKEN